MNIIDILKHAVNQKASDLFIVAGTPVSIRKNGVIQIMEKSDSHFPEDSSSELLPEGSSSTLLPGDTENMLRMLYETAGRDFTILEKSGDDDFSFAIKGLSRFRVSAYVQRGSYSAVIRVISFVLPDPKELNIPEKIINLGDNMKGMVLITGSAGSGKSTTLACIIDHINKTRNSHIITLEDPLEHLHRHNKSIVSQREINVDTENYVTALRAALRQSPDVILLGEMRDYETIDIATTAAETGHLLFSTLHTIGAANTIDRIIDVFPANQQKQIAVQLSMVLTAVVSQQLVPSVDGGMIPAFEIMVVTPAIRNIIRDNKIPQLEGLIYSSSNDNMMSMDASLATLYKEGRITMETALTYATNQEMLKKKL